MFLLCGCIQHSNVPLNSGIEKLYMYMQNVQKVEQTLHMSCNYIQCGSTSSSEMIIWWVGHEYMHDLTCSSLTNLLCLVVRERRVTLSRWGSDVSCLIPRRGMRCLVNACIRPDPLQPGSCVDHDMDWQKRENKLATSKGVGFIGAKHANQVSVIVETPPHTCQQWEHNIPKTHLRQWATLYIHTRWLLHSHNTHHSLSFPRSVRASWQGVW